VGPVGATNINYCFEKVIKKSMAGAEKNPESGVERQMELNRIFATFRTEVAKTGKVDDQAIETLYYQLQKLGADKDTIDQAFSLIRQHRSGLAKEISRGRRER
jgi:hypothetical protein